MDTAITKHKSKRKCYGTLAKIVDRMRVDLNLAIVGVLALHQSLVRMLHCYLSIYFAVIT